PDAAMTAAIVALFARGTTRLNGIGSWRVKETDRIAAVGTELRKLGAVVHSGEDWISIEGPGRLREAWIDTYDDHRIAMCFALAAAGGVPVHVRDPGCVAKTFPNYFTELERLCRAHWDSAAWTAVRCIGWSRCWRCGAGSTRATRCGWPRWRAARIHCSSAGASSSTVRT